MKEYQFSNIGFIAHFNLLNIIDYVFEDNIYSSFNNKNSVRNGVELQKPLFKEKCDSYCKLLIWMCGKYQ